MPLSTMERSRKFRNKVKQDTIAWKTHQEKDSKRKKEVRLQRSVEQRKYDRISTNDRVAAFRKRQSELKALTKASTNPSTGPAILLAYANAYTQAKAKQKISQLSIHRIVPGYATTRALGKAVSRSRKSLPESPHKAEEVIATLASSFGIIPKRSRVTANSSLSNDTHKAVADFYLRDDISRQAPGHRDFITVRRGCKKEQIQKRHLVMTIREVHALFLQEYGEMYKIGKSKFAELRPQQVLHMSEIPENVCLCQIHENVNYLLSSLKSALNINFPGNHHELIQSLRCETDNIDCMSVDCESCQAHFATLQDTVSQQDRGKDITYKQWEKSDEGQTVRPIHHSSVGEGLKKLENMYMKVIHHCYIKKEQATFFQNLMTSVTSKNIVLQVDYSENYVIRHQDAVQADHWAGKPISIYTAVAWLPTTKMSFAMVSDYMAHDKYSTAVYNSDIISMIRPLVDSDVTIDIFSDGAAQHFKQKYTLSNITMTRGAKLNWHFFPTSHGKGAVDGVGGTVKRTVHRAIMANICEPANASDFAQCAKERAPGITTKFIPANTIEEAKNLLDNQWENIRNLSGLHGVHCVRTVAPYIVSYSTVSSSSAGTLFNFKSTGQISADLMTTPLPDHTQQGTPSTSDISVISKYRPYLHIYVCTSI